MVNSYIPLHYGVQFVLLFYTNKCFIYFKNVLLQNKQRVIYLINHCRMENSIVNASTIF